MRLFLALYLFVTLAPICLAESKVKGGIKETKENYLIVGTPKLEGFNDSFIQLQAGKIAVNVLAKSRKYLLMFSAQQVLGKDIQFKRLEMDIIKKGQVFDLKISIVREGDKKSVVKTVSEKAIEKRFLLLQVRKSMYELIFGKGHVEKMKEQLKKENEKDEKELSGMIKKGVKPKKVATSLAQIISDIKLSKTILKNRKAEYNEELNKKTVAENQLRNFKSNIRTSLQVEREKIERDNTDREFRGKEKDKKSEFAGTKKDIKTNENGNLESKSGKFSSSPLKQNPFNKAKRPRGTRLFAEGIGLTRHSSTDFILTGVENDFFLYGFKGTGRVEIFPGYGDDFVFSFMYLKKQGKGELSIPDIKNLHFLYLTTPDFLPVDINMGLHFENQYFVNILKDDASGKTVFENSFVWIQLGIERVFYIWKLLLIPQAAFAKNVTSESTVGDGLKLDATKLEYGLEIGYKNYRAGMKFMQDTVTASNLDGFKTVQTSTFFTVSYVFM